MTTGQKILIGFLGVAMLGGSGYFVYKMVSDGSSSGSDGNESSGNTAPEPIDNYDAAWKAYGKEVKDWISKLIENGVMKSELNNFRLECYLASSKVSSLTASNMKLERKSLGDEAMVNKYNDYLNNAGCTKSKAIENIAKWYVKDAFDNQDGTLTIAGKKLF